MKLDFDKDFIGIVIGATATIAAVFLQHYLSNRKKRGQKYQLVYVRLMHLKKKVEGSKPGYQTFIKRLKKKIDVYDEFQMFNLNVFHKRQADYTGTSRSSGIIDMAVYFPWQQEINFSDKGAALIPDFLQYNINIPSDIYITKGIFYNGLQDGFEDIATKIKYDADESRLILDFSSLRTEEQLLVTEPISFKVDVDGNEHPLGTVKIADNVYMVEVKNAKKDETIRMDLRINWNPIYIFGYGSLINENSAKMAKEDKRIPFHQIEAYLNGYERKWTAIDYIYSEKKKGKVAAAFLDVIKETTKMVNGIIFNVTYSELENLKIREKEYDLIEVTDNIRITNNAIELKQGTFKVFTFVAKQENKLKKVNKVYVMKEYMDKVENGCKNFGSEFLEEYRKTTENHNFEIIDGKYSFLDSEQNNFV